MKKIVSLIVVLFSVMFVEGQDLNDYQYNRAEYSSSQMEELMHGKFIGDYVAQNQTGQNRSVKVYQRSDGYYVETRGLKAAFYAYFDEQGRLYTNIQGMLWYIYL